MRKWIEEHLIVLWIICSIVFAFIIHCLFSATAPSEWWAAKWTAGEILTFVSTVALGLLAVWQNQRFKVENDEAQNRMEQLSKNANELAVISKIIEHETERLARLRTMTEHFRNACQTESIGADLSELAQQPADFMKTFVHVKMDDREKQVKNRAIELLSELGSYPSDAKTKELIDLISDYANQSISLIKDMRNCSFEKEKHLPKNETEKTFIKSSCDYIAEREKLLNKLIYGNLTLDQIKTLYHINASEEETNNEQNENGVG